MKNFAIVGLLALCSTACDTRSPVSSPSAPSAASSSPAASRLTPSISSVSPATAIAGSDDIEIFVTGSQFQQWTFAVWSMDGLEDVLVTQVVNNSHLIAKLPANLLKNPGTAQVIVVNGDFMSWLDGYRGDPHSNAVSFEISPAASRPPSISSVSPASAIADGDDITIAITGSNFQSLQKPPTWSFVLWSMDAVETVLRTQVVSDSQLTAIVPERLLNNPGTAQVSVVNGDEVGWWDGYRGYPYSNAVSFEVVAR